MAFIVGLGCMVGTAGDGVMVVIFLLGDCVGIGPIGAQVVLVMFPFPHPQFGAFEPLGGGGGGGRPLPLPFPPFPLGPGGPLGPPFGGGPFGGGGGGGGGIPLQGGGGGIPLPGGGGGGGTPFPGGRGMGIFGGIPFDCDVHQ